MEGRRCYGAHSIGLLQHLSGPVQGVDSNSGEVTPYAGEDLTLSARLTLVSGQWASLVGLDGLDYELLGIGIQFPAQRHRLEFGAQRLYRARLEPKAIVSESVTLGERRRMLCQPPAHGLSAAYEELTWCVSSGSVPQTSNAENALRVHQIVDAIEPSACDRISIDL